MPTTATTDIIALISTEAAQLRDFMAGLNPADWARSSACAGWTVGDVFAHVTQGARTWSASLTRAMAGDANPPAGEQTLRPGERGSEATAQRAIAFHQEMGRQDSYRPLPMATRSYTRFYCVCKLRTGISPATIVAASC
jgi:uncharacterized protein (TIGR03083 family)